MSLVRTLAVRWTLAAARGLPAGAQLVAETTNVSVALCRSSSVQWPVCSRVAVSRVQHPSLRLGAHVPPDIGVVGFEWTAVGYCRIICIVSPKVGAVVSVDDEVDGSHAAGDDVAVSAVDAGSLLFPK